MGVLVVVATVAVAGLLVYLLEPHVGLIGGLGVAVVYTAFAAPVAPLAMRLDEIRSRRESLRFVRGFEDAAIGMAILTPDLRLARVNEALGALLGRPSTEIVGRSILDFTHPDDVAPSERKGADIKRGADAVFVKRYVRPDGSVVEATVTSTFVRPEKGEPYYFSQLLDVTEELRAERQKAAIAELGRRALDSSDAASTLNEAMHLVREILDAESCVAFRRRSNGHLRLAAASGQEIDPLLEMPKDGSQAGYTLLRGESVVSNDLFAEERFPVPAFVLERGLRSSLSVPVPERSGVRHVLLAHSRGGGREFGVEDVRFLEAVANVIGGALDRAATEDELRRRALEDPLTGLANRALLMTQLERELRHGARLRTRVCLMLLDLDRFKFVNDTLGHPEGDALLRQVAARLVGCVRDEDLVARIGGDEFVIVSNRMDTDRAVAEVGQRIVDAMARPFEVAGHEVFATASVGIALAEDGLATPEDLLRDADAAMYRAKETGGGRFELFDKILRSRLVERLAVESDLRHALERAEMELHYQPLIDLTSEGVVGFEALARWRHPERGLMLPGAFIGIAEETGLIVPIGSWVLRAACAQLALWPEPVYVSVNLSPLQLTPDLVREVEELLELHGLRPGRLVLEITESLVLDPRTKPIVERLRALDVNVALDDFGTGYSSLGSLQRFPLDILKLDRTLVGSLDKESGGAVLRAAVELGRALDLNVVAEGVESRDQLDALRKLGCDVGQGFLFAKPLPVENVGLLLPDGSGDPPQASR